MVKLNAAKPAAELRAKIGQAVAAAQEPLTREQVTTIIQQIMGSVEGDITATDAKFYREIEALARYIRTAKMEIAAIRPKDITDEHIPTATDQLDAVVGATEEATNKIMDECDAISAIAAGLPPEAAEAITASITRIFEACNFQDLTGQRITKVVGALKHIDVKIASLLTALGEEMGEGAHKAVEPDADPEQKLLNGPQLPGQGVSQNDIDRLFD